VEEVKESTEGLSGSYEEVGVTCIQEVIGNSSQLFKIL
jgi:hypothetical protein